jgi:hypothetical protein
MECPFCRTEHPKNHSGNCSRCSCSLKDPPDIFKRSYKPFKSNHYTDATEILAAHPVQKAATDTPVYEDHPAHLLGFLERGEISEYEYNNNLNGDHAL